MKTRFSFVTRAVGLCAAALLWIGAGTALAEDTTQETINAFTVDIQSIESSDAEKVTTTELGLAKAWLGEAQAQLTQDREEELARTVKRIRASIAMMKAKLAKGVAVHKADAARKKAADAATALKKAKADVASLEKELATLSKKEEK
ncbi:MAG: hypothetical protein R3A78_16175 [Polyangiales bacterium]|nr:hypothetical protein [Myxococcales bacterium]